MYTGYQSGYIAHALSLEGLAEEALTQTIASAKVDMNPHQVDAALFALASPLSNGVIPVSYTHLDVYKRQAPVRTDCPAHAHADSLGGPRVPRWSVAGAGP